MHDNLHQLEIIILLLRVYRFLYGNQVA